MTLRRSTYHATFTDPEGKQTEQPLKLINNHWYALEWIENNYWTAIDREIIDRFQGLRYPSASEPIQVDPGPSHSTPGAFNIKESQPEPAPAPLS